MCQLLMPRSHRWRSSGRAFERCTGTPTNWDLRPHAPGRVPIETATFEDPGGDAKLSRCSVSRVFEVSDTMEGEGTEAGAQDAAAVHLAHGGVGVQTLLDYLLQMLTDYREQAMLADQAV